MDALRSRSTLVIIIKRNELPSDRIKVWSGGVLDCNSIQVLQKLQCMKEIRGEEFLREKEREQRKQPERDRKIRQ